MTDWAKLHARFANELGSNYQRAALAKLALQGIEEGIGELTKLGYSYDLVERPLAKLVEYPKMLYKDGPHGLTEIIVESASDEIKLRNAGWRLTPRVPKPELTLDQSKSEA